jgi:DNA-binding CsgD family transcriptional regulator
LKETRNRNDIKSRISHLSWQELQVMQMLLDGESNKRIAAHLGVSQRTIVFRRKSLMEKMNAKSVAQLACLVHAVTNENELASKGSAASLLDVHVTASIYDTARRFNSPDVSAQCDGSAEPRLAFPTAR